MLALKCAINSLADPAWGSPVIHLEERQSVLPPAPLDLTALASKSDSDSLAFAFEGQTPT